MSDCSPVDELSFLGLFQGNRYDLQRQWDNVSAVDWPQRYEATEVEKFWSDVLQHTDAAGEHVFGTLALFVLSLLALPFSNASVERCFSQMNLIKCKLRNRMKQPMLEAILHIRGFMTRSHMCCNQFRVTKGMLSRFNKNVYDNVPADALPDDF